MTTTAHFSKRAFKRAIVFLSVPVILSLGVEGQAQTPTARAVILFKEAIVQFNMGQYDLAIDKFTAAIRANPKLPGPYRWLGLAYRAKNNCKLAVPYFRKYLSLSPDGKYTDRVQKELVYCQVQVGDDGNQIPAGAAQILLQVSEKGAQIFINGVLRGSTPSPAIPVQPGTQTISINRAGFLPWNGSVTAEEGQVVEVKVVLKPDSRAQIDGTAAAGTTSATPRLPDGTLKLTDIPVHAKVLVNNTVMEADPQGKLALPPGRHRVEIKFQGAKPWNQDVEIKSEQETMLQAQLELSDQSRSMRRWAWIITGAAAALGIAGGVMGLLENQTTEQIRDFDRQAGTRKELNDLENSRKTQALVANIFYGVAAAALSTGVILFTIAPEIERSERGETRAILKGRMSF